MYVVGGITTNLAEVRPKTFLKTKQILVSWSVTVKALVILIHSQFGEKIIIVFCVFRTSGLLLLLLVCLT